jgi:hypothetical protein
MMIMIMVIASKKLGRKQTRAPCLIAPESNSLSQSAEVSTRAAHACARERESRPIACASNSKARLLRPFPGRGARG